MCISDYSKALLISSSRIIPHVDTVMGVIIDEEGRGRGRGGNCAKEES